VTANCGCLEIGENLNHPNACLAVYLKHQKELRMSWASYRHLTTSRLWQTRFPRMDADSEDELSAELQVPYYCLPSLHRDRESDVTTLEKLALAYLQCTCQFFLFFLQMRSCAARGFADGVVPFNPHSGFTRCAWWILSLPV
jgi:hypothetical protein